MMNDVIKNCNNQRFVKIKNVLQTQDIFYYNIFIKFLFMNRFWFF